MDDEYLTPEAVRILKALPTRPRPTGHVVAPDDDPKVGPHLVIPDAGPLVALGAAGRWDILDRFCSPVLVADLAPAVDGPVNRMRTVDTLYGAMWQALNEEGRREVGRRFPDARGEHLREFAGRVRAALPESAPVVVLYDDPEVERVDFGPHARLVRLHNFLGADAPV